MLPNYLFNLKNPNFDNIGHVVGTANLSDKHDRSAPSDYHWKILKCRMIIFSNSSLLACPDKNEIKQVHIIFNTLGDDYNQLSSLFLKFSLIQDGLIKAVSPDMFLMCLRYTMTARIAPTWNTLGYDYLINNRDFLTTMGPQDGIKYDISFSNLSTVFEIKPVKIILMHCDNKYKSGDCVRVLPSLNKAIIEDYIKTLRQSGCFKSYKDLRRHWKNIHGYRLPEEESSYYTVRFWRGEPLTYPKVCLLSNFPIITPMPKSAEHVYFESTKPGGFVDSDPSDKAENLLSSFLSCLKKKMPHFLGNPLVVETARENEYVNGSEYMTDRLQDTQNISLCTHTD